MALFSHFDARWNPCLLTADVQPSDNRHTVLYKDSYMDDMSVTASVIYIPTSSADYATLRLFSSHGPGPMEHCHIGAPSGMAQSTADMRI